MLTPASTMLGNPAGALHLGRPTHTRGTPPTLAALSPTPASARSNSIDSFGSNNSVMCRYCSISRFEVGSGGNGGPSERREGYPQPLLRPANSQLTEELLCPRVLGPLRGPRSCAGRECGLADPEKPPLGDRGACVGPRRGARRLCGMGGKYRERGGAHASGADPTHSGAG
jgi:hypothetical protein